ncbi:hypothetical protein [Flagellimonas olearia]|nr:hypothetical protein [Allomuricauda olearia]
MKKILGYTILFLFLSTGARGQDFDLGDIMGEAQEFFGEAQDEAKQASDNKAIDDFKEKFKDKFKKLGDFSGYLDNFSAETKCAYLIFKYKIEMDSLISKTNAEEDCKKKYDLYGMQLMALMSSTSIMYCTEDLFNKFTNGGDFEELKPMVADITQILQEDAEKFEKLAESNDFEQTFHAIYKDYDLRMLMDDSGYSFDKLDEISKPILAILLRYFHPLSLVTTTTEISKQMDKLKPCAESTH